MFGIDRADMVKVLIREKERAPELTPQVLYDTIDWSTIGARRSYGTLAAAWSCTAGGAAAGSCLVATRRIRVPGGTGRTGTRRTARGVDGSHTAVNPAGYYGAYQFDQSTWDAYAPSGYQGTNPAAAPPAVQDQAAASVPYDAWPNC